MTTLIKSSITLFQLKLNVFLGWPKAERIKKQRVLVDVDIHFLEPPLGCVTDNLNDTFCYADLVKILQEKVKDQAFHLLEFLGHEIYQTVKQHIKTETMIRVRIIKKPAVLKYLTSGIIFSYGD